MNLGRDLMSNLGIVLNFDSKSMEWDKTIVAMCEHPINTLTSSSAVVEYTPDRAVEATMYLYDLV